MSAILREFQANKQAVKRRISRYISGAQDIEDLAQEVFIRAYAAELRGSILLPRAYLFRVAKHIALNEVARRKIHRAQSMEDFPDPDVVGSDMQPDIEQIVDGRRRLALLASAIETLPTQCRMALVLKKVEGMSQRDIAKRMGIAESTVEKHLAKGLMLTREYMARHEAGSHVDSVVPVRTRRRLGDGE